MEVGRGAAAPFGSFGEAGAGPAGRTRCGHCELCPTAPRLSRVGPLGSVVSSRDAAILSWRCRPPVGVLVMAALPSSSGVPSKLLLTAVPLTRVRLRGLGWVGGSIRRTQRGGGAHVSPAARRADEQSQCWAASTAPKVRASLQGCAGARRVVGDASVASSPNAAILSRCDRPPVGALVTPALAAAPPPTLLFATTRWLSAQLCFTAAFGALRHRSSSPLSGPSSKLSFPPSRPISGVPGAVLPRHPSSPFGASPMLFTTPILGAPGAALPHAWSLCSAPC